MSHIVDSFNFRLHVKRMIAFSRQTFGPGARTNGILAHITKEVEEVRKAPNDLSEWVDIIILGIDGAWRAGYTAEDIIEALVAKQTKNEMRSWPDWRNASPDQPIEHDRSVDRWVCPIGYPECTKNCGSYGCGN